MIKKELIAVMAVIALIAVIAAYSTYGAPSEFGNETTTTCFIGGDYGEVNCTGNLTIGYGFFEGGLMPRTSLSYDIGSGALRWDEGFFSSISVVDLDVVNDIILGGEIHGPLGNFTSLFGGTISGNISWTNLSNYPVACTEGYAITQLGDSVTCSDYWVDVSGDTMTGDLNMSLNDITGVGRMTLKETGSIWFGDVNARIYSGATSDIFLDATTVQMWTSDKVSMRVDGDVNDFLYFGTDFNVPYINSYGSNLELRPDSGIVFVTGNLEVTGNVTAENVFLHAHIFTHTNVSMAVEGIGIWTNITFDFHAPPIQERITHDWNSATNDTFTIIDSGEYRLEANLVLIDSAATPDSNVEYRFIKNNVEIEGSGRPIDIDRQDYDRVSDTFVIADFTVGDEIKLQFASDSATTEIGADCLYLDHCTSAVISIERVG